MNESANLYPSSHGVGEKLLNILMMSLLFGLGWQIRGSGTSDPTVVIFLFLLFIGILFAPKKKINFYFFGLVIFIFRLMRRGWGTFVAQVGFPGIFDAHLSSQTDGYDFIVQWWQGYFWLFFVGLAWASLASLFLGGYLFTKKRYDRKDFINFFLLFLIGWLIGRYIASLVIPYISPIAYNEVYIGLSQERNYISMRDNFAFSFAMVPVFLYIFITKRDWAFVGRSLTVMIIFGIGLSLADVWQMYGRNNLHLGLPAWSLWEYYSGFIFGGLLMLFYYLIPQRTWEDSDLDFNYIPAVSRYESFILFLIDKVDKKQKQVKSSSDSGLIDDFKVPVTSKFLCTLYSFPKKLRIYLIGHFFLIVYGFQESAIGMINAIVHALGGSFELSTWMGVAFIIVVVDIPLYRLYNKGKIGRRFKKKSFGERCNILLIYLIPFYFLCYFIPIIVRGNFDPSDPGSLATMHDLISALVTEIFFMIRYFLAKRKIIK